MASFPALDLTWRSGSDASAIADLHERLHALLDDFDPQAIHDHESADGWRVFFRTRSLRDDAIAALRASSADALSSVSAVDVADDEWARRSQAHLTPVQVGRVVVAPPWHVAELQGAPIVVVIDPSTGFGTGHHETTRLCLSLLQTLNLAGMRVIDVGTGSGVLAIAAAQLGARSVIAFDEDPDALRNARENVARNGVESRVHLREADLSSFDHSAVDLIVANITAAVIQRNAQRLAALTDAGGQIIASGFSVAESEDVSGAFSFAVVRTVTEGDWAALLLKSRF